MNYPYMRYAIISNPCRIKSKTFNPSHSLPLITPYATISFASLHIFNPQPDSPQQMFLEEWYLNQDEMVLVLQ